MQIVIDIPDEEYERLPYQDITSLRSYIEKGIILPKGHGRLIEDNFIPDTDIKENDSEFTYSPITYISYSEIEEAPTIIEADKGE